MIDKQWNNFLAQFELEKMKEIISTYIQYVVKKDASIAKKLLDSWDKDRIHGAFLFITAQAIMSETQLDVLTDKLLKKYGKINWDDYK